MADKKPEKKAEAPSSSVEQNIIVLIGVFCLLFLIVIPAVLAGFGINSSSIFNANSFKEGFIDFAARLFTSITFISVFLSLIFIVLITYAKMRLNQIVEDWQATRAFESSPYAPGVTPANMATYAPSAQVGGINLPGMMDASQADFGVGLQGAMLNDSGVHGPMAAGGTEKWQDIEAKINSANPADWRLAILEADIVLFDMLSQMDLPGESLGEKLKSADASFFHTIQEAWAAHKIRNVIAHEGSDYPLSYNEARRAIDLYRRVFEEFYFI